jgi:YegS/Rv2252/BmrU family lipid kinase
MKTIFIVNPNAGHGSLRSAWHLLVKQFKEKISLFDHKFTEKIGHGVALTRKALEEGYTQIIAVGGDGTLNECLNGFLKDDKPVNPKAIFGIFPYGRGSDLARALGIPRDPKKAIQLLVSDNIKKLDVGKATFYKNDKKTVRYFINSANVGVVPLIVSRSSQSPKILGAKASYVYGSIKGILNFKSDDVIYTRGNKDQNCTLLNITVANGPYFGSGMKIAPKAQLDDGLFEIIVGKKMTFLEFFKNFPKIYGGKHMSLETVDYFREKKIEIRSLNGSKPFLVEMDGEVVGHLPASFEILPEVLKFKVI